MTILTVAKKAEDLVNAIIERRKTELSKKIERWPRKNLILSDISDCERQMVYGVSHWKEKQLFDENTIARLEVGNQQERQIVNELLAMGFKVMLSQMPVEIWGKGHILLATGRIDGKIDFEGLKVPFEIKSMAPNIFNQVKDIEDFQRKPWLRKYVRQLMMYLFGNNAEQGIFICTDCLGHWKLFVLNLDYGECEAILQRLERAATHIKAETLPDRIVYDSSICEKCSFSHICLADVINKPAEMIDSPEVMEAVDRHEELKPVASEYEKLHKKLKESFKNVEKAFIGGKYLIQNIPTNRTSYELPEEVEQKIAEMKKEFAKKVQSTILQIQLLDGNAKEC